MLRRAFSLPADEVDFPCPHGVPWGFNEPAPPVRDRAGIFRELWDEFHTQPYKAGGITPQWLAAWLGGVPCGECRRHGQRIIADNPMPETATPDEQYAWTVDRHNDVNRLLGKPEWSLALEQGSIVPVDKLRD